MTDETKEKPGSEPLQFPKIEGLGEDRNGHKRKHPTCSDCAFFSVNLGNIQTGFCHGNPPTIIVNQREGNVMVLRPQVRAIDAACRLLAITK